MREKISLVNSESEIKKIYLSRTRLTNRQVIGEEIVEEMFASEGFEIVFPETLSLTEQIKLVVGADQIAGVLGSALHILVFTHDIEVIYIMPTGNKNSNYSMIDQAVSNTSRNIFSPGKVKRPAFKGFRDTLFFLNLEKVQSELIDSGYSEAGHIKLPSTEALEHLYWSTWNAKNAPK